MATGEPTLYRQIDFELAQLRAAILGSEVSAVEQHTARISHSLSALKQLLTEHPSLAVPERQQLRHSIHQTCSLLTRARHTLQALGAVYASFVPSEHRTSAESR